MKKILGNIRNKPMMSFTLFLCTTLLLMILLLLNVSNIYYILLIPFITYYINKIVYIKLFGINY